ncbi:MAG: citramalate synthase, partial [Promethearchaeota archaeon]
MSELKIYDTTLRDGSQGVNISFSANDKVRIVKKLDKLGIHYIEPGFAGSNALDDMVFRQLSTMDFKNARICAFGMTRRPMTDVENDDSIRALLKAGTPVVTIVGKAWDLHVQKVLRTTLDENLSMIKDSIKYFKNLGKEVIFDAEHFFDAYLNNPDYAIRVLKTADDVGADWVVLCDTNGGMLPFDIERVL